MVYTAPTTIITAQLVTAALMNAEWVENIKFLANPPACRVYHNAAQSIASNTMTVIAFNSERYDTATMHDTATNNSRITIPVAGLYLVTFHGQFTDASDYTTGQSRIMLNGTTRIADGPAGPAVAAVTDFITGVWTVYKFAAGDYIQAFVLQRNGAAAARNLLSFGNNTPEFSATWVGFG